MSRSPSRSKSPYASPRPTFGVSNPPPAPSATSRNFPPPRFRKSCGGSAYPVFPRMFRTVSSMWPLATARSRKPSRSTSRNMQPNPRLFRDAAPTPERMETSSKSSGAFKRYSPIISLSKLVMATPGLPEFSKSPMSTPIPARAFPSVLKVKPERRSAEAPVPEEAAHARRIHKSPFAGIAKKAALPHAGDENVRKSVVVVVADSHTHAVHLDIQARASRHIGKRAVAIVPVKPERGSLAFVSGPVRSVDEKNVLPAIAIVIEECTTRAHGLGEELATVTATVVPELNARHCSQL